MAFKFQINEDVKFRHDAKMLEAATGYIPESRFETIHPVRLVELEADASKLMGCGVKESEKSVEQLTSYHLKRDDSLILDFGEHCVGYFTVDITKTGCPMDAPLFLRLKFAEVPAELARESSEYNDWLSKSWIQEEYIHIDELPIRLKLPRRYSFRYLELKVIDTSPKWQAVFRNPVVTTETTADYRTLKPMVLKDKQLQKICDVSIKTLADCMQDVFEDGPKRDRRLWLGDLRLQALANYATFDNADLVKRCLYLFAAMTTEEGRIPANVFVKPGYVPDDTFLFDYSLFFISALYDYLEVHPEEDLLKDLYPVCKIQMDISLGYVTEEGRFVWDEDYPVFVDWSNEFDKECSGQAVTVYVLKQFLALAEKMQDADVRKYQEALEHMTSYAKQELYDSGRKLFVSGANREYNIASQVWMVLAGIMSAEENHQIMSAAVAELFPIRGIATPYMYHHVTEALFAAGLPDEAVKLMKNYWGLMIELGADTYWEAFDPDQPDYSPYGNPIVSSYCHAWGCTPVYLIKKYMLDETV